ncbi:MAG: 3-dehydroquinate dehydratase [Coriobacteriales bacterium]|jgi:3-dehydroquinate dehydratase-2|nr:3-dehydroquinate dehydratase [Coriobacteriales bacterium]
MKILVLHGPNLNLLGQREPETYGTLTLEELNRRLALFAEDINARRSTWRKRVELYFYQSNHEGILIDTIQSAPRNYAGIVYNPAAHTHYSIALRDAIASIPIPVVEVHLSNIAAREGFRSLSVMQDVCIAQFKGRGISSYQDGIEILVSRLDEANSPYPPLGLAVEGVEYVEDFEDGASVMVAATARGDLDPVSALEGLNSEDILGDLADDLPEVAEWTGARESLGALAADDEADVGVDWGIDAIKNTAPVEEKPPVGDAAAAQESTPRRSLFARANKPAKNDTFVEVDTAVQEIDFKSALEKLHE